MRQIVVKNIIEFLDKEFPEGIDMYNTRNIEGDIMATIYDKDGIQIDHCDEYRYIEIFGLTIPEFREVKREMMKHYFTEDYYKKNKDKII